MTTIYSANGITVDYCPYYEYIEVFGLDSEQFEIIEKELDR